MTYSDPIASDAIRKAVYAGLAEALQAHDEGGDQGLIATGKALGATLDRALLLTPMKRVLHGRDVIVYLLHFDDNDETVDIFCSLNEEGTCDVYWDGMNYQCWCAAKQGADDAATELIDALKDLYLFFVYTDSGTVIEGVFLCQATGCESRPVPTSMTSGSSPIGV